MTGLQVLGHIEVMQYTAGGDDSKWHLLHAEAFEVGGAKLLGEAVTGGIHGEHPVLQFEGEVTVGEGGFELLASAPHIEHLFGLQVHQQFIDIVGCALPHEKLAGG